MIVPNRRARLTGNAEFAVVRDRGGRCSDGKLVRRNGFGATASGGRAGRDRVDLNLQARSAVRRGRVATSLLFLLFGTTLGTWTARIPAIKHGLGLHDGQLSTALLAFAAGAITGMQAIGRLVDRYGAGRVMVPAALAEGLMLIAPAYAPDLALLIGALFVFGVVHGTLNIAMNASAVEVQRAWGRPIMSSFHAVYSIGGFLGAGIGGLFARAQLSAATTFLAVAVAMVVLAGWASRWALPPDAVPAAGATTTAAPPVTGPRGAAGNHAILFLGVLAFCALVGEGAAADWSAVYLHDDLGSTAGFAALAYAAFSVTMTAGRLVGDRLAAALGQVRLVRCCAVLASVGLAAALVIGRPLAAVVGFGCLGAGLSCIAPQVFSAAGNRDPARAGRFLARVAGLGYVGFLTGPVLIGGAAELVGLPRALAVPVLLALFVAVAASALRTPTPRAAPA
jgi:MFS family permease